MLTKEQITFFDKSNMFDEIKYMYKQIESSIKIIDDLDNCPIFKKKNNYR